MRFGNMKFKQKPGEEQLEADGMESKNYFEDMAHISLQIPDPRPGPLFLAVELTSWFLENAEINQYHLP